MLLSLLALVILSVNFAVQYGLTRVSANRAIVIYLFELVVTAVSAWLLAGEALTVKEWCGGAMIIAAGLLSERLGGARRWGRYERVLEDSGSAARLTAGCGRQPFLRISATTVVKMPPRT